MSTEEIHVVQALLEYLYTGRCTSGYLVTELSMTAQNQQHTILTSISDLTAPAPGYVRFLGQRRGNMLPALEWNKTGASEERIREFNFNAQMHVVHVAGDVYNVPGLKNLAAKQFHDATLDKKTFGNAMPCGEFAEAVKFLWENTSDGDKILRDVATEEALLNLDEIMECEKMADMMPEYGIFGRAILDAAHKSIVLRISRKSLVDEQMVNRKE